MITVMAFALILAQEAVKADDAIKTLVLKLLTSYVGIAAFTAFVFEGVKMSVPKLVTGRENLLVLALTVAVGAAAKWIFPLYGETDAKAWALHGVILVFVAIVGMMFHDKLMDAVKALLKKALPAVGGGGGDGGSAPGGGTQ